VDRVEEALHRMVEAGLPGTFVYLEAGLPGTFVYLEDPDGSSRFLTAGWSRHHDPAAHDAPTTTASAAPPRRSPRW